MKKKIILGIFLFILFAALGSAIKAKAGTGVAGWIWGGSESSPDGVNNGNETGVGHISMNNQKPDGSLINPGATVSYGVNIPSGDGNLSGYAWSENIGWISFNAADVAGCPNGTCSARREGANLAGWARVMGIKQELEKDPSNSGGWKGFIDLSNVLIEDNKLKGYGWNGEDLGVGSLVAYGLGWINFTGIKLEVVKNLKICRNGCGSGGSASSTLNMKINNRWPVVACYNNASDCSDSSGDVTAVAGWEQEAGNNAISLLNGNPEIVKADNEGFEYIYATFGVFSANRQAVVVACSPDYSCKLTTCEGKDCDDSCGNPVPGTKDCSGWQEVIP